ncbi:MAG: ATP-binding protein [Desulfomicrobium sp.]
MTQAFSNAKDAAQALKTASPRLLSGQQTVLSILVAIVPLMCMATLGYVFYDAAYREKNHALLAQKAMSAAQSIDAFLDEKISNLHHEAASATITDLSDPGYLRTRLHFLQNAYQGVFLDLDLIDSSGTVIARAGGAPGGPEPELEPWFQQAISRPQFVSNLAQCETHCFLGVRIIFEQTAWLLRAHLDPEQIQNTIRIFHPGGSGGAFFLDRQGGFSTSGETGPGDRATALLLAQQFFPENRPVVLEGKDATGAANLYGCAPLKSSGSILVIHQPKSLTTRPLMKARLLAVGIVLMGCAGIVATALALARRTEQRLLKAEREQQRMQQHLMEAGKLAAIGELAAGVAHEINNPLAIMMENAGWIQDLLKSDDPHSEENTEEIFSSLQTITTQGHRCREITHKLLSFARKPDNTAKVVHINSLLEDIAGFARQKAKYRGVEVRLNLDPQAGDVESSPTEIQQIVLNLINNAIDAIDKEDGLVQLRSAREDNFVRIDVEDNGPGIPDDILPNIFEPFFTTKAAGKGTGLGLSICRDILSRMGGSISADSVFGQGCVFHVRLPANPRK